MPTKALLHVFELVHHPEKNSLFCVTISGGKPHPRSEERRGGEEGRIPGGADHLKKKKKNQKAEGRLGSEHELLEIQPAYVDLPTAHLNSHEHIPKRRDLTVQLQYTRTDATPERNVI